MFDPLKTADHHPIIAAYREKRICVTTARARLKELGMVEWEILLYLDDDERSLQDDT